MQKTSPEPFSLKRVPLRLWRRLAHIVLPLLAVSVLLALLMLGTALAGVFGQPLAPEKRLWLAGLWLALTTLFAVWLAEEDFAGPQPAYSRFDQYLIAITGGAAAGGLMGQAWAAALAGATVGAAAALLMRWLKYVMRYL